MQSSNIRWVSLLIAVAMIFTMATTCFASDLDDQIAQCQTNMDTAHHMAECARVLGFSEDHVIIASASERWWEEFYKMRDLQEQLDEERAAEEAAKAEQSLYLYTLDNTDPNYHGHPVELTENQRKKVLRALIGEQGFGNTYEIYVGMLQYIVDHNDFGKVGKKYDNIGSRWMLSAESSRAYRYSMEDIEANETIMAAYDFVINRGGRLFQRILCSYWDDDDAAGWDTFSQNIANSCGGGHSHVWVDCVNPNYDNEWVRYYSCVPKVVS